jgi:hypothetical protein
MTSDALSVGIEGLALTVTQPTKGSKLRKLKIDVMLETGKPSGTRYFQQANWTINEVIQKLQLYTEELMRQSDAQE